LLANADSYLTDWLPDGKKSGNEYIALNPNRADRTLGSFSINWKTGVWSDFATGTSGGDLISLYAYLNNLKQSEAAKALSGAAYKMPVKTVKKEPTDDGMTLCRPIPDDAPEPYSRIKFGENDYRMPSAIYTYTDASGAVECYIYRFEAGNGLVKKEFRPLTCWRDKSGKAFWRFKQIPNNRPLYKLDELTRHANKPVLVVGGEKCVDILKGKIDGYVVITWSGGDNGVALTDFAPLTGRKITWWPDNDAVGKNAMRRLADIYGGIILNIDSDKYEQGWDCYDAVVAGMDIADFIKTHIAADAAPKISEIAPKDIFIHLTAKGKIVGSIENMRALLKYYQLGIRYDVVAKRQRCWVAGEYDKSDDINSFYANVRSACNINDFPRPDVITFLDKIAMETKLNPVMDWITSRPWDNKTRVNAICDALYCDDTITTEFKEILILKWLISAYAAVSREDGDDFRTRGVLVLQGKQYMGKTSFFRSLCGENWGGNKLWYGEGRHLNSSDKDSILSAQKFWITELGELGRTTKWSIEGLKALLTNPSHTIREPYEKAASTKWSRTVYAGTVNEKYILPDLTGNSRFWCLPVLSIKDITDIDMQQVWAEVKHFKDQGATWWLTDEEEATLAINNKEYQEISPVDELLADKLDWDTDLKMDLWDRKTCTTILKDCGMNNPTQGDARRAAHFIREQLHWDKAPRRTTNNVCLYPCPPLRNIRNNQNNYYKGDEYGQN